MIQSLEYGDFFPLQFFENTMLSICKNVLSNSRLRYIRDRRTLAHLISVDDKHDHGFYVPWCERLAYVRNASNF